MEVSFAGGPIEINAGGGLVANPSAHDADRRQFVVFRDVIADQFGRIRKRPGVGNPVGASMGAAVTAMHELIIDEPPAKDYYLFRATDQTIQVKHNGGAWSTPALPYAATAGGLWVFENIDKRCFATNGIDAPIVFDGTTWFIVGVEGPLTPMGYQLSLPYAIGTVSITQGVKAITGSVGAIWNGATMNGKRIEINGVRYTIDTITAAGNGVSVPPQANLTENVKEITAVVPYRIFDGACNWDTPKLYGYAYENPTTGHSSNIRHSSLTTDNITRIVETNQIGRTITLNNIAYSPAAYAQGFTKIRLYRTALDGVVLVGMNVLLDNQSFAGTTTFTETAATYSDTNLTYFPAELTRLAKPPAGLRSLRFRMGRLCGAKGNRFYASLHELETLQRLGVFSESWPSKNNRLIAAPVRGMVTIGRDDVELLIIQTSRGDFEVTGFDDDLAVTRLSGDVSGSYQYGAIDVDGQLVALYGDHYLVARPSGTNYGRPIQDRLDVIAAGSMAAARLHHFSGAAGDFILLSTTKAAGSTVNDVTYVFDTIIGVWYEWNRGFTSFATAHNPATDELQLWASTASGNTYQLLQDGIWQDDGGNFAPAFTTVVIRPLGEVTFGEVAQAQLFVSNASFGWTGELLVNEKAAGTGIPLAFTVTEFDSQVADGRQIEWTPLDDDRTRGNAFQLSVTMPSANSDFYVDKARLVLRPAQTAPVES